MEPAMVRRRPRLLLRFGLVSFVAVVALGVVLGAQLRTNARKEAVHDARVIAGSTARLLIQSELAPGDLVRPLSAPRAERLTRRVHASLEDTDVVRVKLWSRGGQV